MLKKFQLKSAALLSLVLASLVASPAFAQAIDVGDAVTAIGAALVPIGLLGGAVLLVVVAIKTYKWVRRAM